MTDKERFLGEFKLLLNKYAAELAVVEWTQEGGWRGAVDFFDAVYIKAAEWEIKVDKGFEKEFNEVKAPTKGLMEAPVKQRERKKPAKLEHYKPLESPPKYPLELCENLHICLWEPEGTYKWTIAYFHKDREGYDLKFCGDRPLDPRVNWEHFRELIVLGQKIADERFEAEMYE